MKTLTLLKIQISLFSSFTMPNVSIRKYFSCLNLKKVPRCVHGPLENPKETRNIHVYTHSIPSCFPWNRYYFGSMDLKKQHWWRRWNQNNTLQQAANVFEKAQSSAAEIENAGEKVVCILYNGNPTESLNTLRYKRFCEKVFTSLAHIQLRVLPPTVAASKFHSFRVFNQICQWKGSIMLPNEWGWKETDMGWSPISTDVPPAREELLKVIRCNCNTDSSSQRCS